MYNRDHIDLCSGIGGFPLGFSWSDLQTDLKLLCDNEEWCRKILAKNFPNVPIANDVKEIANDPRKFIQRKPFILSGGYPCQPYSVAGRRDKEDPRRIFPYIHSIVEQTRPSWCVFENVYGHFSMGLDEVLVQMETINYATRTFIVPSSSIGALHKRDRIWIICKDLGDSEHDGSFTSEVGGGNTETSEWTSKGTETSEQSQGASRSEYSQTISNSESLGRRGEQEPDSHGEEIIPLCESERSTTTIWKTEPDVGRVVDGLPKRVDRIKGLGNAIVPQNAMMIANAIHRSMTED